MEAEHFDLNVSQSGRDWIAVFEPGYVGDNALQSLPNSWLKLTTNLNANSPRLDYEVEYAAPVTLNVWVRGLGLSGSRDSVWVGVDGNDAAAQDITLTRGVYGWVSAGQVTLSAGVHTINIWMREDGSIVDRLLLTPLSTVPSGDGPPESSRGSSTPGNTPPDAFNDSFTVDEDSTDNALAVLADNGGGGPDSDPDGDPVTVVSVDNPGSANGAVAINGAADGLTYTPAADFAGAETFDYTIGDGLGGTATATVTVTVNNSNNDTPILAPVGPRSAKEDQLLTFSVSASDVDGAPLPILSADLTDLPGTPTFTDNNNGTGSFSWTPSAGDAPGPYSLTFTATDAVDAALSSSEIISIDVQAAGSGGGSGAYQPDSNGQVVMEAEHFDQNVSQAGRDWIAVYEPGYVGDSALQSLPNSWLKVTTNLNANSPRLDYEVEYAAPVTLNVWVRGLGLSGSRDSVWVGVDGNDAAAQDITLTRGVYGWVSAGQVTLSAGVHTINIWMREDGSIVDRLLLTPLSTVPSGDGPPESNRGGGNSTLPLTDDFSDGDAVGWTIVDDATQFPSNWNVAGRALQQSAWTNSSGKDVIETYHRGSYAYWTQSASQRDYRLSVDVLPDATSGDDIGVMFRYTDNDHYYRFSLNVLNGFARLEENLNGTFITLASDHRGYRPGVLQQIVVEVEGPLMQVFVNGDPLFAASNGDHTAGGIALFSRDTSTFDNVVLDANSPAPEIVISRPVAHDVLPGVPLDLDVSAVVRNAPATNGSVLFQYGSGGAATLCNASAEGPSGVFTAQCLGVPSGDYSVEALLLDSGTEIDRDTNVSVAIGGGLTGSHRYDAIGNSITRGVRDNYSFDTLNLVDQRTVSISGWPALLGDLLTTSNGVPNLVGNEGISGDRANATRDERLFSIIERNPDSDRALVMLGTNDSNNFNTTSTADLVTTMQDVIDTLHANGRDTVYLALLPPAWGGSTSTVYSDPLDPSATRNQTIMTYNAAIQSMLPQAGVLLGPDFFSCFLTPTVNRFSLFDDSLHPNALGYAFMAALWNEAITSGPVAPPVDPCPSPIYILESLDPYAHGHKQNLLEEGDEYYTDSAFTLANVPPELRDGIWVMQANADNINADADFLSFDSGTAPVTVYIAYDPAGAPPTSSTHTFTAVSLSENLTVSDGSVSTLGIVTASSVTGTVTIGGNKSGSAPAAQQGYVVIVVQ